jgi:cytochrome c oxidase subunit IV
VSERSVPGTEGPSGHEAPPPVDDRAVPWRVFLAVGAFVLVLGGIYGGTAYEEAGTVMLIVAGLLSLWIGAYLWLRSRTPGPVGAAEAAAAPRPEEAPYLPHASVWPFTIGLGAATIANGLVLGTWLIVPGALVMILGIAGFVRQTRRRD